MMVDEADVDLMGAGGGASGGGRGSKRPAEAQATTGRPNKRRRGPLPHDFTLQRVRRSPSSTPCTSPASTPPSSPCPSPAPSLSPPDSPLPPRVEERVVEPRPELSPVLQRPERPDTPIFQPGLCYGGAPAIPNAAYSPGIMSVSPPGSPNPAAPPAPPPPTEERPPLLLPGDSHPMLNGGKTQHSCPGCVRQFTSTIPVHSHHEKDDLLLKAASECHNNHDLHSSLPLQTSFLRRPPCGMRR